MTVLAIGLALCAAIIFGVAAVNQHRGVRSTLDRDRNQLSVRQVSALVTNHSWRRGLVLMTVGTACHIAALSLAPISLTQPINVLAVPTAVVAAAVFARRLPAPSMIIAAAAVVAGVACFVTTLSGVSAGNLPTAGLLGWVGGAVVGLTVALHVGARRSSKATRRPSWLAPVLLSIAAAVNFGSASSTFRLLAQDLSHAQPLPVGVAVALVGFIPLALTAGSWSMQQAYAAGAASAVTATSALADPLVALAIGMAVLGETPVLTGLRVLALVASTVIAAAGVIHLTRQDDHTTSEIGLPPAPPVRGHGQSLFLNQTRTTHAHPARR